MTAEHAHGIDTGGEVVDLAWTLATLSVEEMQRTVDMPLSPGIMRLADRLLRSDWLDRDRRATRASAADAVLAEARQLCCGENPSAHHAATDKHSERMAFAGDLARAVRGAK